MQCATFAALPDHMLRLLLSLAGMMLFSCNLINPDEQEPGYLHIPEFEMAVLPGEGTSSEKITEVWVYAEEKIIGVYDLPADVPVLANGATDFLVFAGIRNNGISTSRIRYPFYRPHAFARTIRPLHTDTIIPVFSYFEDLLISEKDFESGNFLVPAGATAGNFTTTGADGQVFEGNRSGLGTLSPGESLLYFKDDENLELTSGNTIFLEMNYSCNNTFAIGLLSHQGGTSQKNLAVIINPTASATGIPVWNKIYIDLGFIPLQRPNADYFEIYFEVVPDAANKPVELYLDNLKLVQWA